MAINKLHEILFFIRTVGESDGEWTLDEMTEAYKNVSLDKYITYGDDCQKFN